MKKLFLLITLIITFSFAFLTFYFIQGITIDGHTTREESEGKAIWEKFQAKEVGCEDLLDNDFEAMGEYFMGQMMRESHETMNKVMIQMMGEAGEKQMHIAMGKRMSGCDPSATVPQNMMRGGAMPMMMTVPKEQWSFTWIFLIWILWWVLIIVGIVALIKWLTRQSCGTHDHEKSPLEILKERYAKGEINKKEFEEKKRDLG